MVTDAATLEQLVIARARIRELETALRQWYRARETHGDVHDCHASMFSVSGCPVCIAESYLFWLGAALPTAEVTP